MATRERLPTPYTISPTHDTPFKYMFAQEGESEELLAVFLNHLLTLQDELKIQSLTYHNVEVISLHPSGRRLILDLRVTDQRGVTYNVEIQREDTASIISRALFQQSRITGDQLSLSERFDELTPVVVVLLCRYSTFPDTEVIRLFQLAPFSLDQSAGLQALPHRIAHFDSDTAPRYHRLKRRLAVAETSLGLLRIYLVELDKDLDHLAPDQHAWIRYLMTDYTPTTGDEAMNDTSNRVPQYHLPKNVSKEARAWIQRAQERLERFAAHPEQRSAYEHELLERINHNTLMYEHHEEGFSEGKAEGIAEGEARGEAKARAELITQSIEGLRNAGLTDQVIAQSLKLTPDEIKRYLST